MLPNHSPQPGYIDIALDTRDSWRDLVPLNAQGRVSYFDPVNAPGSIALGVTPEAMVGPNGERRPAVEVRINVKGKVVIARLGMRAWLTATDAFTARYGDPRVGTTTPVDPPAYRHKVHGYVRIVSLAGQRYNQPNSDMLYIGMDPDTQAITFYTESELAGDFTRLTPDEVKRWSVERHLKAGL